MDGYCHHIPYGIAADRRSRLRTELWTRPGYRWKRRSSTEATEVALSHLRYRGDRAARRGSAAVARFERRSLALREALVAEAAPDDVRFRHGLAKAYREMGDLYRARASRAGDRRRRSAQSWREARSWYGRSLDLWQELERRGVTTATADLDAVRQQLARVDAELSMPSWQ